MDFWLQLIIDCDRLIDYVFDWLIDYSDKYQTMSDAT